MVVCFTGLMEEVNDSDNENDDYGIDDGDDQNATDDSDLIGHSHTDQANVEDDAVGCFTSHTGLLRDVSSRNVLGLL